MVGCTAPLGYNEQTYQSTVICLGLLNNEKVGSLLVSIWRTVMKFGTGIDLVNILDEFEGQGHKSKAKVIQLTYEDITILMFLAHVPESTVGPVGDPMC